MAALFALKEEALDLQTVEGKVEVDGTAEWVSERAGILAAARLVPGILGGRQGEVVGGGWLKSVDRF